MGYVVVFSLPLVFICIICSIGCFYMGRHKGQQEGRQMVAQQLQPPLSTVTPPPPPPYNPNPLYLKPENGMMV
ncbi:hypothetical protein ACOSP7_013123 [Xanthoceras sorbifolium]